MPTSYEKGNKFREETVPNIIFQLNSNIHKCGVWIEVLEKQGSHWAQSPWFSNEVKALIVGNEKMLFFLDTNTVLHYLDKHKDEFKFNSGKTSIGLNIPLNSLTAFPCYHVNKKMIDKTDILHVASELLKV